MNELSAKEFLSSLIEKYNDGDKPRTLIRIIESLRFKDTLLTEAEKFKILTYSLEEINKSLDEIVNTLTPLIEDKHVDMFHDGQIPLETRAESYSQIQDVASMRKQMILDAITDSFPDGATAKELADYLYRNNFINTPERNATAPRLNELVSEDGVKIIGKKKCQWTNRMVSVYTLA